MAASTAKISSASTPAGWELSITRVFDAPRALVFDVWTKPEHLAHWWGPKDFTLPVCEMDFRVGGAWRFVFRGPDGKDYGSDSVFREIIVPERIVFTSILDHIHGCKVHTTLTFTEHDGKTMVTIHQIHSVESDETKGALVGWTETLDRLDEYLAKA
jgi:uncharacterized protein YndB with AHSA1/START domain